MRRYRTTRSQSGLRALVGLVMILMISAGAAAQQAPGAEQPGPAPAPAPAPPQPAPPEQPSIPQPRQQIEPVTDQELQQFAEAVANVQKIQVETQTEVEGAIEESELSRERFVEIFESSRIQGAEDTTEVTEDEQLQFDSLIEAIAALEMRSQESMIQAVDDAGLELQRFNDILNAVQTDPALMEQLRPHLEPTQN